MRKGRKKALQKPRSVRYGREYVQYRERVKKSSEKKYKRRIQRPIKNKGALREKYPIQEDRDKKEDALDFSVSGGHFESNRRKH